VSIDQQQIKLAAFRRALSCFATGVTVVTTLDSEGQRVGITVSSFNSVSLDPPLVLWSIGKDSLSYDAFVNAKSFVVNVLSVRQSELSNRFAAKGVDKFDGLDCRSGIGGAPILPDVAACFECSTEHLYAGGDHTIIVGRVEKFADREVDPLIIHRSSYLQ
jgi:flavin reductase (DIM6/NTAB) family NADH-FMN oxidoreductase RutF